MPKAWPNDLPSNPYVCYLDFGSPHKTPRGFSGGPLFWRKSGGEVVFFFGGGEGIKIKMDDSMVFCISADGATYAFSLFISG